MKNKLLVILMLLLAIGCTTTPKQVAHNSMPLEGQYKEMGEGECKKCSFLLLDIIPIRFHSMVDRAYECAAKQGEGNNLISSKIEESWYVLPLVGVFRCTKVSGKAIQTQ